MSYRSLFERVASHVAAQGIKVETALGPRLRPAAITKACKKLPFAIPQSLVDFYLEVGDGLHIRWITDDDGPFANLEFPSVRSLVSSYESEMSLLMNDNYEFDGVEDPSLAKNTLRRMRSWLFLVAEGNGDSHCMDCADSAYPIVYSCHDWFDGGTGANGAEMAPSLHAYFAAWAQVCFQFPSSLWWPNVLTKQGVNWDSDEFRAPFRLPQRK